MRVLALLGLGFLVLLALGVGLGVWILRPVLSDLPPVESLRNYRPPVVTTVWTRDGQLMAELFEERRKVVDVSTLPQHVFQAFLAAEDSQFFQHEGLDWKGILRAAWANLRQGRVVQGGSTITQQVAKSLLLSPERSYRRKLREAVLALRIEKNLSKREILHLYLNQIYLGHGAYGVESASEVYFGISSRKLSLAQAALLAGLPQAPSRYDPHQNPERALERRHYVLQQMAQGGWITRKEAAQASEEPLGLSGQKNPFLSFSPYFSETVRQALENRYGREAVLRGGLRVVTTMDARLQGAAQKTLRRGVEALDRRQGYRGPVARVDPGSTDPEEASRPLGPGKNVRAVVRKSGSDGIVVRAAGMEFALPSGELGWAVPRGRRVEEVFRPGDVVLCEGEESKGGGLRARLVQEPEVEGALVCLDPGTGEVLASVGGYDYGRSQFNRAVQAERQPGSAIKPLIYAAAIEKGYTPATVIYDAPVVYDSADPDEKWKPKNFSDQFYGPTTLRDALVFSRNIVTVKILEDIGIPYATGYLETFGLRGPITPGLSLALGATGVDLLELAAAYSVFPAGGLRRDPVLLLRVEDRDGQPLEVFAPPTGKPVLRPETAYVLTHMMESVIEEGTGRAARGLGRPCAGKTGTTNENRDAWFIGFTPDLVAAVWTGYDDSRNLAKAETGGKAAAPIWLEFMREAVQGRPAGDFPVPAGIEFAKVDAEKGKLADTSSKNTFTAAFRAGTVPPQERRATQAPATSHVPVDTRDPGSLNALR